MPASSEYDYVSCKCSALSSWPQHRPLKFAAENRRICLLRYCYQRLGSMLEPLLGFQRRAIVRDFEPAQSGSSSTGNTISLSFERLRAEVEAEPAQGLSALSAKIGTRPCCERPCGVPSRTMVEQRHAAALVAFKGLVLISHYEPPIRHSDRAISNRKPECRQRTLIGSIATPEHVDLLNSALATIPMDPAKPPVALNVEISSSIHSYITSAVNLPGICRDCKPTT